ncbi:hypothetical protein MFLAVUS_002095 [Mucor flavus]|uniref:Uncharacterized protein n=1 Tax=Mucor flavus TaxID=439312 RepID=A0ABP9YPC5_9FUNG
MDYHIDIIKAKETYKHLSMKKVSFFSKYKETMTDPDTLVHSYLKKDSKPTFIGFATKDTMDIQEVKVATFFEEVIQFYHQLPKEFDGGLPRTIEDMFTSIND